MSVGGIDIEALAEQIKEDIDLADAWLPNEYFYHSLTFCVIDAVFSIGVLYSGVENVVQSYACCYGLKLHRDRQGTEASAADNRDTLESLVQRIENAVPEEYAETVFKNRCRTSTKNGILKTEAVAMFARCLLDAGVSRFGDVPKLYEAGEVDEVEKAIREIPGQKTNGLSYPYFLMLAGNEELIKPDRMILRYLANATGFKVKVGEAQHIVRRCVELLSGEFPDLTPRLLDYEIWKYQRGLKKGGRCW